MAGDLRFVDAVVAENGAVVHVSGSNHTTRLAAAVPPLVRRGAAGGGRYRTRSATAWSTPTRAMRTTLLGIIRELDSHWSCSSTAAG